MSVDPNLVGSYLEQKLKGGKTVTYQEIVSHFGLLPLNGLWSSHPLSNIFEVIDQQDANASRPFRTSAVVSKELNSPGDGFYDALGRLKGISIPKTKNGKEVLWTRELNAAFSHKW